VAGPAPNSFMFWSSFILPRNVPLGFFIRGDTVKTVSAIYKGRILAPLAVGLVLLFRQRVRALLARGRGVVFAFGDRLLPQYPAEKSRQYAISPLIDRSWINPEPRSRGLVDHTFRVLFLGRLSPEKNIANLIEACAAAARNGHEFQLTVVGEGPLRSTLVELVAARRIGRLVSILGHLSHGNELKHLYDTHDLLCLPSLTEGTPRVIAEAAARGLPIAATEVGSVHAMCPGAIVPIRGFTPEHILEAIDYCRECGVALRHLAERAWRQAPSFDISSTAGHVAEVLLNLAR
jgi:glycosyltransferase involved in cell wall biosynthesis